MLANGESEPNMHARHLDSLFPGESEMARLMRAHDWSRSALGNPRDWPAHLRTSISLCLTSRNPIVMYWGAEFNVLYNDAYISFLGPEKHPRFLGAPGWECWREIWDTIGPMLKGVIASARATWSEDLLMHFARRRPLEEVFVRFSFGPILRPDGSAVDGIFCPCTETTERVIGQRRLDTLRRLGVRPNEARTTDAVCVETIRVLADNPRDLPFAAVYLAEDAGAEARLCASAGIDVALLPPRIAMDAPAPRVPSGALDDRVVQQVLDLPVPGASRERPAGLLRVGVSDRLVLDENYRGFFELIAGHLGSALADAQTLEAERRRAEALAEIDRAKTSFFTNVSHEFRTPLALMLGPLEDLRRSVAPGSQRELVGTAQRNAERLLKLVNTLLDFARVEGGRIEAHFEPVDLAASTADLASNFRSACERAGLTLRVDCPPLPRPVYVAVDQWEKIVLNLLSNAFKFTLAGEIAVSMRTSDDGHHAELVVRDTGTGIPASEMPKLFSRFQRIDGQVGRSFEGSGIGLALVQELVKLHGGTIKVESHAGKGTAFAVRLPFGTEHLPADRVRRESVAHGASSQAPAFVGEALQWLVRDGVDDDDDSGPLLLELNQEADGERQSRSARILVADDNADLRGYLQRLLGREYAVQTARNGLEALEIACTDPPDLVISDVMMPGLDGFGLIDRLRADARTRTLPVIVLSARAGEEARVEGLAAGADDYLVKPFSARELLARVAAHLAAARIRREADAARRESDEFLRAALAAAGAGTWSFDPRTEETQWSVETYALLGIDPSSTASTAAAMTRIHPDDAAQFVQRRDEQLERTGQFDLEFRLLHPRDGLRWHQARGRKREDGRLFGIWLDITERKRAEEALRDAYRRKDEFLATLAHELRNPLAPIRNALHLLKLAGSAADVALLHDMLERQVNQMVRLVDDLMEASRISRGMLELRRRPVELAEVLQAAVETSKPLIDAARHQLIIDLPPEPLVVDGDAVRLAQVFANLLNNAAKYTDAGGRIELSATCDRDSALVMVRDNGIGIDAAQLPRLFEMFAQGPRSRERSQGGLGIGLSLVKRLVQMHGGTVQARSDGPGCGSTFVVALPLVRVASPAPPVSLALSELRQWRILVVDDNRDAADSLGMLLRYLGAEPRVVYDGPTALDVIPAWQPAVVLLDLGMLGMDGFEVARRLRANASLNGLKLVALTGWGQHDDRQRTRAAGFDLHLIKPIDINVLQTLLERLAEPNAAHDFERSGGRSTSH